MDPTLAKYMTTSGAQKIFALIYGPPVSGKTTGALTFPSPVIIDIDHNLRPGIPNVIPLWDDAFVDKIKPRINPAFPANRRDALLLILADLARSLPADHTIIVDSLTRLETWYNTQESLEPKPRSKKTGEEDGFEMFRKRLTYFEALFTMFTNCAANVVMLVHQQQDRDEKGQVTGQIKPSLQGQIGEKMPGYFPIVMQAVRKTAPGQPGAEPKVEFLWRIRPGIHEPARVPKPASVDFIKQDYHELLKFL